MSKKENPSALPCPFCGETPIVIKHNPTPYSWKKEWGYEIVHGGDKKNADCPFKKQIGYFSCRLKNWNIRREQ